MAEIDHKTRKADGRGRVSLGPDYADREVEIVVIDDSDDESHAN